MKKYLLDFSLGVLLAYIFTFKGFFGAFEMNLGNIYTHLTLSILVALLIVTVFAKLIHGKSGKGALRHILAGVLPVVLSEFFGLYIAISIF